MFTPLDILYIVLAFCVLWLSAGIFWLIWQVATIFRRVNDTIAQAQDTMGKMEEALSGIRSKFEHTSSLLGMFVDTTARVVDHFVEKKLRSSAKQKKGKKIIE